MRRTISSTLRHTIQQRIRQAVRTKLAPRASAENAYLLLIPTVGVLAGVSALAIAYLMSLLQMGFWGAAHDVLAGAEAAQWWRRLLGPMLGGAVVAGMAWLLRHDVRGAGTAGLTEALALRGGHISTRRTLPSTLAGIVTVSSGGSLGREGPMIELAAAMGSRLGRRFGLGTQQVRVLVCCGAAAAISAVYNAPIGGTIFVMEILIGSFALEIFGPVVIASVISTLIFRGAMGDLPRFVIPTYELVSVWELAAYLALGVLGGLFSVLTIRCIGSVDEAFRKWRAPGPARTVAGFALVGAIGIVFPHVFGNGAESVNLVLHEQLPLYLLLALPVAKLLATALTRGSGGSGGIFTPTLMMGALVGGAFGYVVHGWFPLHTAEYGAYALVGMGAVLAGTTHAPIMAIMMIFEQTDSYSIILPLMMVCTISNLVARRIQPESLHLDTLRRRGVLLPAGPEAGVMKTLRVADVMHDDAEAARERDPFPVVVDYFLNTPRNHLYVVDDDRNFVGSVPLHAIKNLLAAGQSLDVVIAADLVEPFECVTPDEFLADTMEKFWGQHAERLPVVESYDAPRLVGWVSQRDLIGIYNQEILGKRQLLAHFTIPDSAASGDGDGRFVELPEGISIRTLVVPATFGGKTIREIAPRSEFGVHVLQVAHYAAARRKPVIEMPGPDSVLYADDRLVVVGAREDVERLQRSLHREE